MPWSDYPANVRQFKTLVESAAYARFGSAATVEAVAMAARDAKLSLTFADYSSIAKMYGEWVGVRNSNENLAATADTFARTGLDQGIQADMIGRPPYAPAFADTAGNPFVLATGSYTQETPEGSISGFFSHRYHLSEVHTIGQVMEDMQAQMEQNAGGTDLSGAQLQEVVSLEWSTP